MGKSIQWLGSNIPSDGQIADVLGDRHLEECTISRVKIPIVQTGATVRVRLFNTDPKHWNVFMFPYEATKLRIPVETYAGESVSEQIRDFLNRNCPEYPAPIQTQYEIKASATSSKMTLYVFNYEIVGIESAEFPFEYVDIEYSDLKDLEKIFDSDVKFASNVPVILRLLIENIR